MNTTAEGVLPDDVIRDPRSNGEIIYLTLADDLPTDRLEAFLRALTAEVDALTSGDGAGRAASACVGFGRRFFDRTPTSPLGIQEPPAGAIGELVDVDIVLYVLCREEWRLAEFRRALARHGVGVVNATSTDRGHQRPDGRELGGFLDGLRNAPHDRAAVVFVDRDRDPDQPTAAEGGSFMVTMRVVQDLAAWEALSEADQEQVIGRRKADGSRLDMPVGTPADQEGEIGTGCPLASHVAKSGPRSEHRDKVQIFRRGVPFVDLAADGTAEAGLLFVSFQASMAQFSTIFDEWMGNADFPDPGTGADALFARGLAHITHTGLFFVPAPAEFLGAEFLHPDAEGVDRCNGRIAVRKRLVAASGEPIRSERGGFGFQLFAADGSPVGEAFVTDSTGRAVSPAVPLGETYILREVTTRPGFDTAPEQAIELSSRRHLVEVTNTATESNPGYGR